MATLYITEYNSLAFDSDNRTDLIQCALEPEIGTQTLAIGAASVASQPFNERTRFIRVHTDAICSVKVGSGTPVAAATNKRMAADQTEYWGVQAGHRIAVITNT